jgi:multicomponent Na+:H+ antiporter subunit D
MFTICSLSMVGIPPTGGFLAKWYLIMGSLDTGRPNFDWAGPVFLLISALLTAGYLFTIVMRGFFPGEDYADDGREKVKLPLTVYIPIGVLMLLCVLVGIIPNLFMGGGM